MEEEKYAGYSGDFQKADYEGHGNILWLELMYWRSISLDAFYKNFLYKGDYGIQIKSLVLQGTDSANEILEFCSEKLRLGLVGGYPSRVEGGVRETV